MATISFNAAEVQPSSFDALPAVFCVIPGHLLASDAEACCGVPANLWPAAAS